MPVVLIIGTSHEFQRATLDVPPEAIGAFRDYLRQAVVENNVVVISEEMSSAALAENGLAQSVAQGIASELGIAHDLADPSPEDRRLLGIRQRNEIELAGFLADRGPEDIEDEVRHSYDIRENFWILRLVDADLFPAIFICGASHVHTLRNKLMKIGHDALILTENWAPVDETCPFLKSTQLRNSV